MKVCIHILLDFIGFFGDYDWESPDCVANDLKCDTIFIGNRFGELDSFLVVGFDRILSEGIWALIRLVFMTIVKKRLGFE
jgi:hypothetical protein